jgi:hypothetical protein
MFVSTITTTLHLLARARACAIHKTYAVHGAAACLRAARASPTYRFLSCLALTGRRHARARCTGRARIYSSQASPGGVGQRRTRLTRSITPSRTSIVFSILLISSSSSTCVPHQARASCTHASAPPITKAAATGRLSVLAPPGSGGCGGRAGQAEGARCGRAGGGREHLVIGDDAPDLTHNP